jgi:hypothetical protein
MAVRIPAHFDKFLALWNVFIEEVDEDKPITGEQFSTLLKMDCIIKNDYQGMYEIECAEREAVERELKKVKEELATLRASDLLSGEVFHEPTSKVLPGEVFHTEPHKTPPSPIQLVKEEDSCSSMPPLEPQAQSPVTPQMRDIFRRWLEPTPVIRAQPNVFAEACAAALHAHSLRDSFQHSPMTWSTEERWRLLGELVKARGKDLECKIPEADTPKHVWSPEDDADLYD